MDPDFRLLDLQSAIERVAILIREIDEASFELRDMLLLDLLRAAWPGPVAQNQ